MIRYGGFLEINLAVRVSKSNERPCRTAPNSHETSPEKVGNEKGERRLRIRSMHKLRDVRKGKYEQGKRHGHRWQRAIKGSSQNTTTHSPDPTLSSRVHAMKSHDNWHRGRLTRTTTRSLMEPNLPKARALLISLLSSSGEGKWNAPLRETGQKMQSKYSMQGRLRVLRGGNPPRRRSTLAFGASF